MMNHSVDKNRSGDAETVVEEKICFSKTQHESSLQWALHE